MDDWTKKQIEIAQAFFKKWGGDCPDLTHKTKNHIKNFIECVHVCEKINRVNFEDEIPYRSYPCKVPYGQGASCGGNMPWFSYEPRSDQKVRAA